MKDSIFKEKYIRGMILVIASIVSLYSFYFFLSNKVYLIGSDTYYYMSIADSIIQSGKMENLNSIPSTPIKSPQNGVAFIFALLSLLGISHRDGQLVIVFINYIVYLGGIYPLFMITKHLGLTKKLPLVSLLGVYLSAWHVYRINLLPINDGIFNSLILWLVYFLIKLFHDKSTLRLWPISRSEFQIILCVALLTILSIQFRLNTVLVIGSSIISGILVKNYRATIISFLLSCLMLLFFLSIFYFLAGVPSFKVSENFHELFTSINVYNLKMVLWKILPGLIASLSPLSNPLVTICFTIFPLSMLFCLYRGYIEKNYSMIFVALICLTGLWFTFKFKNSRVIFYTFPFMYLLLFCHRKTRVIAYGFVLFVFLQSFQTFFHGFSRGPESKLFLHIYENNLSLPDQDSLLITNDAPHTYFLLNTRAFRSKLNSDGIVKINPQLTWSSMQKKKSIFVLGGSTYINSVYSQIDQMAISNGYKLNFDSITPDYDEFDGWALVELILDEI